MRLTGCLVLLAATACVKPEGDAFAPRALQSALEASGPRVIAERGDTFTMTVALHPVAADAGPGPETLRSVLLHVPNVFIEPHAVWANGVFATANAKITQTQADGLQRALVERQFFAAATLYHTARRNPQQTPPPAHSQAALPVGIPLAHVNLNVGVHDDDWYYHFTRDLGWGKDSREILEHLRGHLDGPALALIDQLIDQLPL